MADLTRPEEWARFYGAKVSFGRLNRWVNRRIIERELYDQMAAVMPHGAGASLIEMGCANSDWLPYYWSTHGCSVYGIDYLEEGCRLAERKLEQSNCDTFSIFCGDFRELHETVGRRFDVLVSFGVIEHFEDPATLIAAFGGYLRENGLMITVCPNTAGFAMHMQKYVDKAVYDGHLRFDLEQLIDHHRRGGFEPVHASYLGFLSLNNLDFSGYRHTGSILKMLVKLTNGPLVAMCYVFQKLGLPAGNPRLYAAMMVAARKTAAGS